MTAPVVGRRRNAVSGVLAIFVLLVAFTPLLLLNAPSELAADVRAKGALLWVLCYVPAFVYVRRDPRRRQPLPVFPLVSVVFAIYYALPALLGAVNLAYSPNQFRIALLDPRHDYGDAIDLALLGAVMVLVGYALVALFYRPRLRREPPLPRETLLPLLSSLVILGMLAETLQIVFALPTVIAGGVGFLATLNRFGIAVFVAYRARGLLPRRQNLLLAIAIPVELIVLLGSGSIAKVFLFVLVLLIAQYAAGGRIRLAWLASGIVIALALIALKGVLGEYRREVWFSSVELSIPERAMVMENLVADQVRSDGVAGAIENGWSAAISRSATLDLLADIVRRTPSEIPFWGGRTYLSLVGLAIPRVLWPSKPVKMLGQDFGHRYSYIEPYDRSTSINFPFLIEFYANFAWTGVALGMLLTGMIYRVLDTMLNVPGQSIIRSLAGLSIMLPLLNIESDFSLVFGGLFLNMVAFSVVLGYVARRARRGQRTSPAHRAPGLRLEPITKG